MLTFTDTTRLPWKQVQRALHLFDIDPETIAIRNPDHKSEMLMVAIGQVFVVAHKPVRRLQGEQATTGLQHIYPMHQLAALHANDHFCPGAGCNNTRHIGLERVHNTETAGDTQVLGELQLIAQQAQVAVAATQQEHARMWGMRHVRQQFIPHGPVAGMPAAVVA